MFFGINFSVGVLHPDEKCESFLPLQNQMICFNSNRDFYEEIYVRRRDIDGYAERVKK